MAVTTYRDIYGFETGADYGMAVSGASAAQSWILDGTAHTGCYYGKCLIRTTGGYQLTRSYGTALVLPANATSSWDLKVRCYLRLVVAPDQNLTAVVELGNGAAALPIDMALRVNTDRTWEIYNNFALPQQVTGGPALPLNTWFLVTLVFNWKRTQDVSDKVTLTITANGDTLTTGVLTFGNLLASAPRADRVGFGTLLSFNGGGTLLAGEVHIDDLTLMFQLDTTTVDASVTLPTATRIRLVPVTAQGSLAAWTGSFTNVQEVPLNTAGAGQTSTVAGQVTTFQHSVGSAIGVGGIQVFKVYGHCKSASTIGTQQIRLQGVDYPVEVSTIYETGTNTPMAVNWASGGFDGSEFGFVNSTGAALTLGAIHGEVLYTATASGWFGCGLDPSPPAGPGDGCVVGIASGSDSAGGAGCQPTGFSGSDSAGGSGCQVIL